MEITLDQIKAECREVLDDAKTCSHVERNSPITPKLARATLALIEAMEEREKSLSGSMWSFESALTNLCATWNQPE